MGRLRADVWFPWLSAGGRTGSRRPAAPRRRGRPGSGTGLLNGLVEVGDGLVHRDLGGRGGTLQVVVGDVLGVAVIVVRDPASAGQAHGSLPPSGAGVTGRFGFGFGFGFG